MQPQVTSSTGPSRRTRFLGTGVAVVALAALAIGGASRSVADETDREFGATGFGLGGGSEARASVLGTIRPSAEFRDASFVAAGVGLRNHSRGGITISGSSGTPMMTYVYWASITESSASSSAVRIKRTSPAPEITTSVKGTVVGRGPTPCWGGTTLTVFRGTVNPTVATGNGTYEVEPLQPGVLTDGADPWEVAPGPPYAEGASLLVIYPAERSTVSVFDRSVNGAAALSGQMFQLGSSYTLVRNTPSQGWRALFAEIGADGQTGGGHRSFANSAAGETTKFNGTHVAGGSSNKGSDWDGDDGSPLPQLWDTHIHDVRGLLANTTDNVEITPAGADCLSHVANVIAG